MLWGYWCAWCWGDRGWVSLCTAVSQKPLFYRRCFLTILNCRCPTCKNTLTNCVHLWTWCLKGVILKMNFLRMWGIFQTVCFCFLPNVTSQLTSSDGLLKWWLGCFVHSLNGAMHRIQDKPSYWGTGWSKGWEHLERRQTKGLLKPWTPGEIPVVNREIFQRKYDLPLEPSTTLIWSSNRGLI